MSSLSFVVKPKKQNTKFKISKQFFLYALIAFCSVLISYLLCVFLVYFNADYLNIINLPKLKFNILSIYIVAGIMFFFFALSMFLSFKYDDKFKQLCVSSLIILLLNVCVCLFFFVFHLITVATLLLVSNTVLCCYYLKLLKLRSLGLYLFLPYLFFQVFVLFYFYIIFLLNWNCYL